MNLEKAAKALVDCGFGKWRTVTVYGHPIKEDASPKFRYDGIVDPLNNEAQRQALLEWFKVSVWYDDVGTWGASQSYFVDSDMPTFDGNATRIEAENACLKAILET